MNYFLAKTDPETYSIDDFEREKLTAWDGVTNAQAVRAIREMRPGDLVFIYHSGGVSSIVGMSVVRSQPRDDPKNSKSAMVDLEFAGRLEPPVTLAEIKLGAGAAGPSVDHGGAGEIRGLDARAVSEGRDLIPRYFK
jgi:predicted RNA-binding protein with PUA-like domain